MIILAIITAAAVALIINNTAGGIIDDYKTRFGAEVNIRLNESKLKALRRNNPTAPVGIPSELYLHFSESEYLRETEFNAMIYAISDQIHCVDYDNGVLDSLGGDGGISVGGGSNDIVMAQFRIIGKGDLNNLEEFKKGERQLIDGQPFSAQNECVISAELAELNGIKVGDIIYFGNSRAATTEPTIPFTVTGIYLDLTTAYDDPSFQNPFTSRRNEVLVSVETSVNTGWREADIRCTYFLHSPDDLEAFAAEMYSKGFGIPIQEGNGSSYSKLIAAKNGGSRQSLKD